MLWSVRPEIKGVKLKSWTRILKSVPGKSGILSLRMEE